MYTFKRLILVLVVILLAALVVFFVLENHQMVSLVVLGWSAPAMPVAVIVLAALVLGLAVGPILGAIMLIKSRMRARGVGSK